MSPIFNKKHSLLELDPRLQREVSLTRPASNRKLDYNVNVNIAKILRKLKREEKERKQREQEESDRKFYAPPI